MSVKVANNRFIVSSFEKWGKLYQYLVSNIADFQRLGAQLIGEAQKAQALRQINRLEEISTILSHFPIREYRLIGQYHLGWCAYRKGKDARAIFENVIENSATYRSMALIDLATIELSAGNCDSGIKFCTEAIRQSHSISTIVNAARSIAVIQSVEGFHNQALKGLEAIAPITRYVSPIARHQYFNSLAVELSEVGRVQEAGNISQIVLASPYAFAYPEWRGTNDEIAVKRRSSRSIVSFSQGSSIENVVRLPVVQPSTTLVGQAGPARILDYANWKKRMVKEPNGEQQDTQDLSDKDIFMEIMHLSSQDNITRQQLEKILEAVKKITVKPDND